MTGLILLFVIALIIGVSLGITHLIYHGDNSLISLVILITVIAALSSALFLFITKEARQVERLCKEKSKYEIINTVKSDGFYINTYTITFSELDYLFSDKYKYIEISSNNSKGKYRRYYLAHSDHPSCLTKNNASSLFLNHATPKLSEYSASKKVDTCIAMDFVSKRKSMYEFKSRVRSYYLSKYGVTPIKGKGYEEIDSLVVDNQNKIVGRFIGFNGGSYFKWASCFYPDNTKLIEKVIMPNKRLWRQVDKNSHQ